MSHLMLVACEGNGNAPTGEPGPQGSRVLKETQDLKVLLAQQGRKAFRGQKGPEARKAFRGQKAPKVFRA
jgi:hypothetical protein